MIARFTDHNPDVAELIDRVHDRLLTHGWTQKVYLEDDERTCLIGGINALAYEDLDLVRDVHADLFERYAVRTEHNQGSVVIALAHHIIDDLGWRVPSTYRARGVIISWNDIERRTYDDVLEACRQTAKRVREVTL